jgi:hypothetical protein
MYEDFDGRVAMRNAGLSSSIMMRVKTESPLFKLFSDASRRGIACSLLAGALIVGIASAQSSSSPQTTPAAPVASKPAGPPSHYLPNRFAGRAGAYYRVVWGVDALSVKLVESGEIIRFSWHVLDANKARVLNDKKAEPSLIDPQAGVSLVVPAMENIGQLRQSQPAEAGQSYWMAFSNKGRIVKRGDRVNVQIGPFHADGLAVD